MKYKNKNVAATLAFFLGGLGIHEFYLGRTYRGILMLIFSFTLIPIIIGICQGIRWWCMENVPFNHLILNEPHPKITP